MLDFNTFYVKKQIVILVFYMQTEVINDSGLMTGCCDVKTSVIENNATDKSGEYDIEGIECDSVDKQEVFDRFLTYRRRMARMAAVQVLFLYDIRTKGNFAGS